MLHLVFGLSYLNKLLVYPASDNDYPCVTHMRDNPYLVLFFATMLVLPWYRIDFLLSVFVRQNRPELI